MPDFTTKDSGEREQFQTGAQRDTRSGKGRFDLLPAFALEREAQLLERGAEKYDPRNWEQGFPFSRCLDSAFRHLTQYVQGDDSEDHLAAVRFNVGCIMHFEEMIRRVRMNPALNDLPNYRAIEPAGVPPDVLRAAWAKFGDHKRDCFSFALNEVGEDHHCDCGFDDIVAAIAATEPSETP